VPGRERRDLRGALSLGVLQAVRARLRRRRAGSPNRALLARYGIDPSKGFPALVLSDEALKVAEVTKAGEAAALGAKGKDEVRAWLLKRFKADPSK
jgi:hypothetical protein